MVSVPWIQTMPRSSTSTTAPSAFPSAWTVPVAAPTLSQQRENAETHGWVSLSSQSNGELIPEPYAGTAQHLPAQRRREGGESGSTDRQDDEGRWSGVR